MEDNPLADELVKSFPQVINSCGKLFHENIFIYPSIGCWLVCTLLFNPLTFLPCVK